VPARRPDPLSTYRAKRALERTPEPAGVVAAPAQAGGLFVVHLHAARRLHYDLRLEMDGVLRSWAVPKGPSADPQDKRLAVLVEDHPVEYGDFEGVIPEGNYGAGAVIVWDRGQWVPVEDPGEGLSKGKLLFDLKGYKLKGRWTLVRIKPRAAVRGTRAAAQGKDWLLIKERDAFAAKGGAAFDPRSVLSGLSVEELGRGEARSQAIVAELERLHAPRRAVPLARIGLMLAESRDSPFSRKGWIYEIKYDGYRMLAERAGGEARLLTRNAHDATGTFPEVVRALRALPYEGLVLDGEVVCLDEEGRPSFDRLQRRGRLSRPADVRAAAVAYPATYFVFDLLTFRGFDLRPLPLIERKRLLRDLLPAAGPLRYADHVEQAGEAFYRAAVQLGLEGIVAKQADAPYRAGRSRAWLKVRAERTGDFVVVAWTAPRGSRAGFGALHLADYVEGRLTYAGRVGSGFEEEAPAAIRRSLEQLRREEPPCEGPLPRDRGTIWVEPKVVCEVRFKEWTEQGLLRQPVFLRFRDDKPAEACVRERGAPGGKWGAEPGPERERAARGAPKPPAGARAGSSAYSTSHWARRRCSERGESGAPSPRSPRSASSKSPWASPWR
jgi:bifunctional non-homologous end joining protein LigD